MNDKLNPKSTNTDKVTEQDSGSLSDVNTQVDSREYRPLEVVISITMHDLQAHLIKVSKKKKHIFEINKISVNNFRIVMITILHVLL